jgi:hypothetical protein
MHTRRDHRSEDWSVAGFKVSAAKTQGRLADCVLFSSEGIPSLECRDVPGHSGNVNVRWKPFHLLHPKV